MHAWAAKYGAAKKPNKMTENVRWIAKEFLGIFMNRRYRGIVRVEASSQRVEE